MTDQTGGDQRPVDQRPVDQRAGDGRSGARGSAGGAGVRDSASRGPTERGQEGDDRRSFEDLMSELEEVTERLASADIGIEAAADLYERAEHLHHLARARLAEVQERVARLSRAE